MTMEETSRHFDEIVECVETYGRIAFVADLGESSMRPSEALRKSVATEMKRLFRYYGDQIVAVAHVTKSITARAVLRTFHWLVPPPFPTIVTASREEAVGWAMLRIGRGAATREGRTKVDASREPAKPRPRQLEARAATGIARTLATAARARGMDVEAVLARAGLPAAALDDVDGYVSYRSLMALLELVAATSEDANFGLHTAEQFVDAATLGIVGFAARSSTDLREAIDRVARYARLVNENTELTVTSTAGGIRVDHGPIAPLAWPRHYAELALAALLTLSRAWTGVAFPAGAVGFRHARPTDVAEHRRVFGCEPRFDARSNYLVIPNEVLSLPLCHGDRMLGQFFDNRLEALAATMATVPGTVAQVREVMMRSLSEGLPSLASVGRRLGMSTRTLQRQLGDHGITFSEILDSVRREVAMTAITRPGITVQELAFICGFLDVKAFRKAFCRWTGVPPREYRAGARLVLD